MTIHKKLHLLLQISVLLVALSISQNPVIAQIVDQSWTIATMKEKQQQWHQADSILTGYLKKGIHCQRADILQQDSSLYLLPDGTFDVYQWHQNHWRNLYKSIYYGYNRGSKKIAMNGTLLSFGGYGYWYQNRHLIRFDFPKGEWELMYNSDMPFNSLLSVDGHSLISYGENCSRVDLKTFKSSHIPDCGLMLEKDSLSNLTTLEFKSYTINLHHRIAIHKSTQRIFQLPQNEYSGKFQRFVVLQTLGDSLIWWSKTAEIGAKGDYIRQKGLSVEVPGAMGAKLITNPNVQSILQYLILLGLVLLIFLVFWYWKSNVNDEPQAVNQVEVDLTLLPVINTLINTAQSPLSVESLDELFGIHTLSSLDTQRYKRAQLIREINKYYTSMYGRELIQRRPDPEDGRKYIYLIQPV